MEAGLHNDKAGFSSSQKAFIVASRPVGFYPSTQIGINMSDLTINLTPKLYEYLQSISLRETKVLSELRQETHKLSNAQMQISPEQGQFLALLMKLMNAKKTLDIGTFTGYSALVVALALPADGEVYALDVNYDWTDIAKQFWQAAEMSHKIKLNIAKANETLDRLIAEGHEASFDFAFIDADKAGYDDYYEKSLRLLRQGGLIAIDNVLWSGAVADEAINDQSTRAIRNLNKKIHKDSRVFVSLIPIGDGLTLAYKL